MKRNYEDMDEWLRDRIDEDLMAMADEREKLLMESVELQDIGMPLEKLEDIHRELEARRRTARRIRIRRRTLVSAAAVAVLCVGMGLAGSGSRLYRPRIVEGNDADRTDTKIDNVETIDSEYDDEEVCREIEEKLGVISLRLGYQPEGTCLSEYWVNEDEKDALLSYEIRDKRLYIYISKNYEQTGINSQIDGKKIGAIKMESSGIETNVIEYQDSKRQTYYAVSFEYLNTYYSISGMVDQDEFIKILENSMIKNVE